MNEKSGIPSYLAGHFLALDGGLPFRELQMRMWEVVKKINLHHSNETALVDLALSKCTLRPVIFSRQGIAIAMFASPPVREVFRARLVECGMFLEAMFLADLMKKLLTRDEVVELGNRHMETFDIAEAVEFIVCAMKTSEVSTLDLRRLYKQFGVEAEHISL